MGAHAVTEILDLVDRYIDLFEQDPTVDAILAIAGPGERYDFSSGARVRFTTDDAVFNIGFDDDPVLGIADVSISNMRNPPTLDEIVERYGPGDRGPNSAPGCYPYSWMTIRQIDEDEYVSLGVIMSYDKVNTIIVDR
jgi:hypothetical protein